MILWKKKLWYYEQNYGTLPRTIELRFTKGKKEHGRLSKTKKLLLIMKKKTIVTYQNN